MKFGVLALFSLSFIATAHAAVLEPVVVSSEDKLPAPRWIYGFGDAPKESKDIASQLAAVKKAQVEGKNSVCVDKARAARGKAKSLQAWLTAIEIDCAMALDASEANANKLSRALETLEKNASWMLSGPPASRLRASAIKGYQMLLEQDAKTNRTRGWTDVDHLQAFAPYMDDAQKAKMWRGAGELAFVQQRVEASQDFLKRSLAIVENDEVRTRLNVIDSALAGQLPKEKPKPQDGLTKTSEASREELDLVDRITTNLKMGDLVPAMEDAVRLIREFPGGTRAKWASDRVIETVSSLADKVDPKYEALREQIITKLVKADSERLAEWARVFYNRGQYGDALTLSRKALEMIDGSRRTTVLDLEASAAIANEDFDTAGAAWRELVDKHAGQPQSREALFRLGLLKYRQKNYGEAISHFEKLLALPKSDGFELSATYWLWRSLQKAQPERAAQVADKMLTKFPFSYYGLRARAEMGDRQLEWDVKKGKVETKFWFTTSERLAWEKILLLIRSGWIEEAQAELRELPAPQRADERAVRSLIWAAAGGYGVASKLANDAWDEKSEFRRPPFTDAAFPRVFDPAIKSEAEARSLDADLVRGLIKQESAFNVNAISTSNALGLMQMIPPTAKDIASQLKLGTLELPKDMFDPKRNIKMGTFYLSQMLNKYQGHVPLALAAYNAGPNRIDRWLRARPSLKKLPLSRSSAPENELWIDEIPYAETSYYVKAILRNVLLYKLLDQGRVQVGDPVWIFEPPKK